MIITGMLFFFALSSEIAQKNLHIFGMVFPFLTSIVVVYWILDDQKIGTILAYTQTSLIALFIVIAVVYVDSIILNNYVSDMLNNSISKISL